jgi:hypothetical protein
MAFPATGTSNALTSALRESQSRPANGEFGKQIHPLCATRSSQLRPRSKAPNGGSRASAVTSDRDAALELFRGATDLIADSARCPGRLNGVTGGMQMILSVQPREAWQPC